MSARVWLLAARPKTLTASVAPVTVGTALATAFGPRPISLHLPALALLSAISIQIGTNLVNDASDFTRGADADGRLGPLRVAQGGLATPGQVMAAAAVFFALAACLAVPLVVAGGIPVLVIGLLSVAAGYAYTAGPLPLAYVGLGEAFVLLFFGFAAVEGTCLVLARSTLPPWSEVASLQVGLQSATLLAINNLRDVEGDLAAGKRTLAARFGIPFARAEIAVTVLAPFVLGGAWLAAGRPWAAALPLALLPLAISLVVGAAREPPSPRFNPLLARSALLQLAFAVLLAIGLSIPGR